MFVNFFYICVIQVRPVALIPSSIPEHIPQILINRYNRIYLWIKFLSRRSSVANPDSIRIDSGIIQEFYVIWILPNTCVQIYIILFHIVLSPTGYRVPGTPVPIKLGSWKFFFVKIITHYNGRSRIRICLIFKSRDPDPQVQYYNVRNYQNSTCVQGAAEPPEVRCGAAGWLRHHHQPDLPHVRTKKTCRNNKRTVSRKFTPHFFAKLIHLCPWLTF